MPTNPQHNQGEGMSKNKTTEIDNGTRLVFDPKDTEILNLQVSLMEANKQIAELGGWLKEATEIIKLSKYDPESTAGVDDKD